MVPRSWPGYMKPLGSIKIGALGYFYTILSIVRGSSLDIFVWRTSRPIGLNHFCWEVSRQSWASSISSPSYTSLRPSSSHATKEDSGIGTGWSTPEPILVGGSFSFYGSDGRDKWKSWQLIVVMRTIRALYLTLTFHPKCVAGMSKATLVWDCTHSRQ